MAYGQDGHIGVSFQESFGTAYATASVDYMPFISESLTENIEDLISESLSSRIEEPDPYEGMHGVEGDIALEVHPHNIGKFLKAWAGQESVSYTVSMYSHNFVPVDDDWDEEISALPPMTVEVYRDTGSAYQYFDMLCNQLVFEISQGAIYKCTASMIGAQFDWMSKTAPSYEVGSYFTWDTVSLQLGGSAIADVSELTITLNNNLEGKAYLDGNKYFGRVLRNDYRTIEVAGTMLLVGDAEARKYRDRTLQRLLITATDPSTVMLDHNRFELDIPAMRYTEFPANIGGPNLVEISFSGKGGYDATSSYAVQFTLTNTTDEY
jgi:hypothetical protein